MIIPDVKSVSYGKFMHGRKSYHMGRWYVRTRTLGGTNRYSVTAYVSPRFTQYGESRSQTPRTSARGLMVAS